MKPGGKPAGKPGGALGVLKDKRVMIGAAVAGGLGLVALLRRGGGGAAPDGAVLSPAQVDSSGTDLYNALQGFTDELRDIRDLLDQRPSTGTGAPPPGTGAGGTPDFSIGRPSPPVWRRPGTPAAPGPSIGRPAPPVPRRPGRVAPGQPAGRPAAPTPSQRPR